MQIKSVGYIILPLFLLMGIHDVWPAMGFSISQIPDSLMQNAQVVVRRTNTLFEYKSEKLGVEKRYYVITVLNRQGEYMANLVTHGDQFRKLKAFSAKLYNADGVLLRKFGKSDIQTVSMNDALASDLKYYYFHCEAPVFPFTVEYEYEMEWKNGIFSFPIFLPQSQYSQALEQGYYELDLPESLSIRFKALNRMPEKAVIKQDKGRKRYMWKVENLKPIVAEKFAPEVSELTPMLYVSPESFVYDRVEGTITDWESYGKWVYGLFYDRNVLPEKAKTEIRKMTEQAESDMEKVAILYNYLAETTRYVSIQLGIGGFQPMPAAEVYETGFGDCKALSFYLKSMLEMIGIPSNYVEIYSDERNKNLMSDYATFYETNHVILQVPLEKDTLWLECTNPRLPFGFVHNNIAGHDAIEIKESGGRFCTLPDYPDSLNIDKNKAEVMLEVDGSASVKSIHEFKLKAYHDYFGFHALKRNEQLDIIRRNIGLLNAEIKNLQIEENKSACPSLLIAYEWDTELYGNKTGNRLFVPLNPFRSTFNWFKKKERKYDIDLWRGFNQIDSLFIEIPEGYIIESLPAPVSLSEKYGRFKSTYSPCDKGLWVVQSFLLLTGRYGASEYQDIQKFFEQVNIAYSGKIILRKE